MDLLRDRDFQQKELSVDNNINIPKVFDDVLNGYGSLEEAIAIYEKETIIRALKIHRNNKAMAARILGIPLSTLKRRVKEYYNRPAPKYAA
jgi:DNA-binding NtrC family response regulator